MPFKGLLQSLISQTFIKNTDFALGECYIPNILIIIGSCYNLIFEIHLVIYFLQTQIEYFKGGILWGGHYFKFIKRFYSSYTALM